MRFEYTGRHVEVTPAIRDHVETHFSRINHLFEKEQDHAHIIIDVEHGQHISEIVVKWKHGVLSGKSSDGDMYQSLSHSIDKIEKQALKTKNKIIDRSHKSPKLTETPMIDSEEE